MKILVIPILVFIPFLFFFTLLEIHLRNGTEMLASARKKLKVKVYPGNFFTHCFVVSFLFFSRFSSSNSSFGCTLYLVQIWNFQHSSKLQFLYFIFHSTWASVFTLSWRTAFALSLFSSIITSRFPPKRFFPPLFLAWFALLLMAVITWALYFETAWKSRHRNEKWHEKISTLVEGKLFFFWIQL